MDWRRTLPALGAFLVGLLAARAVGVDAGTSGFVGAFLALAVMGRR